MKDAPASDRRIRQAAIAALGRRCVTAEALAGELEAAGIDLGREPVERLEGLLDASSDFVELDAGWLGTAATLDGTRWITTVEAGAAKLGQLAIYPDLTLLGWWVLDAQLTLGDTGESVTTAGLDDDVLQGPRGWLDAFAGGEVELQITGTALHLAAAAADASVVPPETVAALRATFEQHARPEELRDSFGGDPVDLTQTSLEELLWQFLVTNRDVLTAQPMPPIDRLLSAAGLTREDEMVLRGDVDLEALHRWYDRKELELRHGLEGEELDWAELAIGMSHVALSGAPDPLGPPQEAEAAALMFVAALEDPGVCEAVLMSHLDVETPPRELARFAQSIIADVPNTGGAGVRWLEGRALDLDDDPRAAVAAFEAAVATGEEHPLALIGLAGFRSDSGDAPEALALLLRAGVDPDDREDDEDDAHDAEEFRLFAEVAGYARHRPPARAGRNDPCPCGSGRKYKVCHLAKERHDLVERGPWLYAKARRYARDHDHGLIMTLAGEMCAASGRADLTILDLVESSLVGDIALCEGGIGESFVAHRDALLPDDEAILAAEWQLVERSLFEVDEARKTSLVLRDLRTGERITVTNTSAESQTRGGELLLGRPLPIADTWRAYSGFIKVGRALRDDVIAALDHADPIEMAQLVGHCLARPRMQNTEGDELEFHELVWKLPDPEAARRALDAHDALEAGDDSYSLVRDTTAQRDTVILTLTIEGDQLHSEVNSERRANEAIALVAALIPAAELVDHDIRGLSEAIDTHHVMGAQSSPNLLDDPEMAGARDEIAAEMERRWLDEHIPALAGMTPREAAADPIQRQELERLLEMVDRPGSPLSAARLRKALDL